jgi:hypothetical protein
MERLPPPSAGRRKKANGVCQKTKDRPVSIVAENRSHRGELRYHRGLETSNRQTKGPTIAVDHAYELRTLKASQAVMSPKGSRHRLWVRSKRHRKDGEGIHGHVSGFFCKQKSWCFIMQNAAKVITSSWLTIPTHLLVKIQWSSEDELLPIQQDQMIASPGPWHPSEAHQDSDLGKDWALRWQYPSCA